MSLDVLKWWYNTTKYKILPRIAVNTLTIPINNVDLEVIFIVRTRVIDSYCTSLDPKIVEMLMCAGDWCRKLYEVKKREKVTKNKITIRSVEFINKTDGKCLQFIEIVHQPQLPKKVLIYDCKTRWNSTYEMLAYPLKFQEVSQDSEMESQILISIQPQKIEKRLKKCATFDKFFE